MTADQSPSVKLVEAVERLVADPPYHDCRGPACRLCGLADVLAEVVLAE